jgi:surface antigen
VIAAAGNPTQASLTASATLGGIVVSPVVGGRIGARFDIADQACATAALELAPIGSTVSWQSGEGVPVTFQPTRSYQLSDGQTCRDFVATARFASKKQTLDGTACRINQTGGWRAG